MRFLGLGLGDRVPDSKTVWLWREALARGSGAGGEGGGGVRALRRASGTAGLFARGGQILDASIVPVPRTHNTRAENAAIKAQETPEDWAGQPTRRSPKAVDARWSEEDQKTFQWTVFPTNKNGKSHYGYKNHVNVDCTHKLIRRYHVTDAAVHDSQAVDHLSMQGNTGSGVWAAKPTGPRRWRQSCAPGS